MRNEHWNKASEIKRRLNMTDNPDCKSGPILFYENGKKYSDDQSESHIAVIGRTGTGKSQCGTLPYARETIEKGQSLIALDPKGELYRNLACYIPENYQKIIIDFRNPRTSYSKWNPLSAPYRLYSSDNPDDNDIASSMISDLWSGVIPYDGTSERYWTDSAINYARGITYGLFETGTEEQINLDSIATMMQQSEMRFCGSNTVLKEFYDSLPSDSLAKRNLATYVTAPNETRGSIHSVAESDFEIFSRSKGLMEMLSEDTLSILDIDVEKPLVCFLVTPDETNVYDQICGIFISQLTQHLIRVAQERGGRLPIRVNLILEELGSVGRAISQLPNLMVASRSRNIRIMLVLQSGKSQLEEVYGKSRAETINSCIGITIGFTTNNWDTLTEWSQRCGERQINSDGHIIREPLITPSQLAAMPTGTALIMIDSQYKYIAHLPFYAEMYDNSNWVPPKMSSSKETKSWVPFDFQGLVQEIKKKEAEERMKNQQQNLTPTYRFGMPTGIPLSNMDIERMMRDIDEKIKELEAEEESDKK